MSTLKESFNAYNQVAKNTGRGLLSPVQVSMLLKMRERIDREFSVEELYLYVNYMSDIRGCHEYKQQHIYYNAERLVKKGYLNKRCDGYCAYRISLKGLQYAMKLNLEL